MSDQSLGRPRTERVRVEDLVNDDVPGGRYRVPSFQRTWRWTRDDILDLFDSLWRGFPVGVILCWVKPGPAESIHMGDFTQQVAERSAANFIIDGQQRITSLVGVLRHPQRPDLGRRGSDFELYFDLEEEQFRHRDKPGPTPPCWVPMNQVADSTQLSAWLDAQGLRVERPELYRRALNLGRQIREHELLMYVVETGDEAAIRQLFARLNNTGRRLRETEVFDGLHRAMGGPIDDLDHLVVELAREGFGALSKSRLLQVCLAVGGAEFKSRLQGRLQRSPLASAQLEKVKPALVGALSLLRDHAGLPTGADLPHTLGLCAVAILVDRFGHIDTRNAELLSRFIWRGAANDALNGRDQELAARVYAAVRGDGDLHDRVQALLKTVPRSSPGPANVQSWNPTRGLSRLFLLALEAQSPRDLRTRRVLDTDTLRPDGGRPELVRIFGTKDVETKRLRRSLGNYLLHPKVAGLSSLSSVLGDLAGTPLFSAPVFLAQTLDSHAITPDAWSAFQQGDTQRFLELREAELQRLITGFIAAHARWDDPDRDRPPIFALIEDEDDDLDD